MAVVVARGQDHSITNIDWVCCLGTAYPKKWGAGGHLGLLLLSPAKEHHLGVVGKRWISPGRFTHWEPEVQGTAPTSFSRSGQI